MPPIPKIGLVYIITIIAGVVFATTGTIAFIQETSPVAYTPNHLTSTTLSVRKPSAYTQKVVFPIIKKETPSTSTPKLDNTVKQKEKFPSDITTKTTTKKIIASVPQTIGTQSTATITQKKSIELPAVALSIRKALVNITCEIKMRGTIARTSGSGVFISPKGYIITNAHVAQYLLLKNYPYTKATTCVIRTGSPARARYNASIVFLSSDWLYANVSTSTSITSKKTETGKHDIAILTISGEAHEVGATTNKVPTVFPFVPLGDKTPTVNEPVIIGSYAAQFLSPGLLKTSLYPTITYGNIKKLYTLASTTVDVVALGATAAAQEGSSGGGVLNANGKLTALIVIGTITGPTNTRSLDGITAQYIRRTYKNESGKSLNILLTESTTTATKEFSYTEQKLSSYFKQTLAY